MTDLCSNLEYSVCLAAILKKKFFLILWYKNNFPIGSDEILLKIIFRVFDS